jgi:ureidoglycolate lyase
MDMMADITLPVLPLTAEAFAAFGQVIAAATAAQRYAINEGTAERFHDLARIDTTRDGGRPVLSLFRAMPRPLPLQVKLMERHQLGSQAFMPLGAQRFLVLVAPPGPAPTAQDLRCFIAAPGQGVNFDAGTWHHPLIALDGGGDFLVIDRAAAEGAPDCDEVPLAVPRVWLQLPS